MATRKAMNASAHPGREDIACAADGLDHFRMLRVRFDLAPQSADLNVDRAVERPCLAIARRLEQLVSRMHTPGSLDERREQFEFAGGQLDGLPLRRFETASIETERPAGEANGIGVRTAPGPGVSL